MTRHDEEPRWALYPKADRHAWCFAASAFVLAVVLLGYVCSLAGCCPIDRGYVEADRLTYETVGRQWLGYRMADPGLDVDDEELSKAKLRSWEARVKKAEACHAD